MRMLPQLIPGPATSLWVLVAALSPSSQVRRTSNDRAYEI
jgi:hypothetical protein